MRQQVMGRMVAVPLYYATESLKKAANGDMN